MKIKDKKMAWASILVLSAFLFNINVFAQVDVSKNESVELKTASKTSYTIQKYSGFNYITEKLTEQSIKLYIKLKTKSKKTIVDISSYSGLDLLKKKAKSLTISLNDFEIKDIPIKHFETTINDPIYIKKLTPKKNNKRKNKLVLPINIQSKIVVDLNNINDVLANIPKWKKISEEIDLPIPPFGSTKVKLNNLKIEPLEKGRINVRLQVISAESVHAEPIDIIFSGNLSINDKKIIIKNLESEAKDIFVKGSELEKSFSIFLEDLINPILNLNKYEKKGFTIDDVKLDFDSNYLILNIYAKKNPENFKSK